jgi:ComF family protein
MRLSAIVGGVLDLCFPWSCAVCKASYEGAGPVCGDCDAKLRELEDEPHCGVCASPLPMAGSPCPYCMGKGPVNFERVVRLAAYADPLRELIIQLKYHRKWGLGEGLANRLLEHERAKELLQETEREGGVLVPVPLHWKRHFLRWYNQAEVIARQLGGRCGIPVARPVKRIKPTEAQTHLHSRAQREQNLRDAFGLIDPAPVAGKHVVIVDDVWTTGATMQALARVLKKAKPASISAIVLAVADPKGYERVEKSSQVVGAAAVG